MYSEEAEWKKCTFTLSPVTSVKKSNFKVSYYGIAHISHEELWLVPLNSPNQGGLNHLNINAQLGTEDEANDTVNMPHQKPGMPHSKKGT